MSQLEDAAALSRVRSWLRPELLDAEESRRTWRLLCIQAEAERRNLTSQAANVGTSPGSGSPSSASHWWTAGSPRSDGTPDERGQMRGATSPTAPVEGSFFVGSAGTSPSAPRAAEVEAETEMALAKALAFERHIGELTSLIATLESDADAIREGTVDLEACLADRRTSAQDATQRAAAASSNAHAIVTAQREAQEEHARKCELLIEEAEALRSDALPRQSAEAELESVQEGKNQLAEVVEKLEGDIDMLSRKREGLLMSREEVFGKRRDLVDSQSQSRREAAAAKHASQARAAALTRLQGEVLRTRSKSERKRKELEGTLVQCRSELQEATGRSTDVNEKLRKLKQQQGKQLRELRSETDGLQAEVDEHLLFIETSELSTSRARSEEAELENDRLRNLSEVALLEERAEGFMTDVSRLKQEVAAQEATAEEGLADLRRAETELAAEERLAENFQSEAQTLRISTEAAEATAQDLKAQLLEEQELSTLKNEEVENLEALEAKVRELKARNAKLIVEHLQLQDSATKSQKDSDKHFVDMHEAIRRAARLKSQHSDVVDAASSKSREALMSAMDQALGRVTKKAEAVISCLETVGPGSAGSRSPRLAQATSALSQRSQAALQRRLLTENERGMENLLSEERRKVVFEQQRSLTEARRRSSELQKARQDRRGLQEDLARCQQAYDWARRSNESELNGLEAQVKLVDREATEGAEAVTAEFSDLLQKQALERDVLQAQVEELRAQVDGGIQESAGAEEDGGDAQPNVPTPVLLQRLAEQEAEAEALRAEEEELLQAHVKLKAAMLASKQHLQEDRSGKLQPLNDAGKTPLPATGWTVSAGQPRVRRTRSPVDPSAQRASGSSVARAPHRNAAAPSGVAQTASPQTPTKSLERWRDTQAGQSPATVCTTDGQEDLPAVDNGSDPIAPYSPSRSQHQRVMSANTVSSQGASSLTPQAAMQLGAQLSGLDRSVSSHSVSTSGSTPNLPSTLLGGVAPSRSAGRAGEMSSEPLRHLDLLQGGGRAAASFSSGAVCTWPSGMSHMPIQQDTGNREEMDPRYTATLG